MASTVTAESRAASAEYVMPAVKVGDIVLWYHENKRSSKPIVGLVTEVDNRSVQVTLFATGVRQPSVRDGVRHIDDPKTKEMEMIRTGCWDYTDAAKADMEFKKDVEKRFLDIAFPER